MGSTDAQDESVPCPPGVPPAFQTRVTSPEEPPDYVPNVSGNIVITYLATKIYGWGRR